MWSVWDLRIQETQVASAWRTPWGRPSTPSVSTPPPQKSSRNSILSAVAPKARCEGCGREGHARELPHNHTHGSRQSSSQTARPTASPTAYSRRREQGLSYESRGKRSSWLSTPTCRHPREDQTSWGLVAFVSIDLRSQSLHYLEIRQERVLR